MEYYAQYIGSPLSYGTNTPDRIFNNYDSASKEIRLRAMELSIFRIKVKSEDIRKIIGMPIFDEIEEAKRCLIGISNNMILNVSIDSYERNDKSISRIMDILKIDKADAI